MGADGKTPLERLRWRRSRGVVAEFGKSVLYIPLRGDIKAKKSAKIDLELRFQD